MNEKKKNALRKLLSSMERRKDRNFVVVFKVNGEEKSEYDMGQPYEIDSKSPQDWLNSCFFWYHMGKLGSGEVELVVKQ